MDPQQQQQQLVRRLELRQQQQEQHRAVLGRRQLARQQRQLQRQLESQRRLEQSPRLEQQTRQQPGTLRGRRLAEERLQQQTDHAFLQASLARRHLRQSLHHLPSSATSSSSSSTTSSSNPRQNVRQSPITPAILQTLQAQFARHPLPHSSTSILSGIVRGGAGTTRTKKPRVVVTCPYCRQEYPDPAILQKGVVALSSSTTTTTGRRRQQAPPPSPQPQQPNTIIRGECEICFHEHVPGCTMPCCDDKHATCFACLEAIGFTAQIVVASSSSSSASSRGNGSREVIDLT